MNNEKFKRAFGVERDVFLLMLDKLNQHYADSHKKGGRIPKINTLNHLCIFFAYCRHYRTMEDIANEYEIIRLVERVLCSCEEFQLPDREKLKQEAPAVVVIDATECELKRLKKGHQNTTAGRKRNIHKKRK